MEVQECILVFFAATLLWQTSFITCDLPPRVDVEKLSSTVDVEKSSSTVDVETSSSTVDVEMSSPTEDVEKSSPTKNPKLTWAEWLIGDKLKPFNDIEGINSIYDITVKDLDGNDVCLSKYKGQVLIIVNYASACIYTYENTKQLSKLAKRYGPQGLQVLIFPCNSFMENVGGNYSGVALKQYHPEFEVFYQVKANGAAEDIMYTYLKNKLPGSFRFAPGIGWNFVKFVIDRNGQPQRRFSTSESFQSIEDEIQKLLVQI